MTYEKIVELQKYIQKNSGVKCHIGEIDLGKDELPAVLIIPDENGIFDTVQQTRMNTFQFNVKIKLEGDRKPEQLARNLQIFDKIIRYINNFNSQEGHFLNDDFSTEYDENKYMITLIYKLRLRIQNT